jgi:hypothetical protein
VWPTVVRAGSFFELTFCMIAGQSNIAKRFAQSIAFYFSLNEHYDLIISQQRRFVVISHMSKCFYLRIYIHLMLWVQDVVLDNENDLGKKTHVAYLEMKQVGTDQECLLTSKNIDTKPTSVQETHLSKE